MKYFINLFIISLTALGYAQSDSKNIEVTYIKAYKNHKDSTNTAPKPMKNLEYQLVCNFNEARFEYISAMSNDGNRENERFIGRGGGRGIYYKNLKEEIKLHQIKSIDENTYLVNENLNKYDWKLLRETKKILGYDCFKAIANYKEYNTIKKQETTLTIVVWYTPSIPVSFGPAGYDGLPGLVLESSSSSFYLIADNITILKEEKDIKRPNKGKEVTLEEFNDILNKNWLKIISKG